MGESGALLPSDALQRNQVFDSIYSGVAIIWHNMWTNLNI